MAVRHLSSANPFSPNWNTYEESSNYLLMIYSGVTLCLPSSVVFKNVISLLYQCILFLKDNGEKRHTVGHEGVLLTVYCNDFA